MNGRENRFKTKLKRPGQKRAALLWDLFQYIKGYSLLLCNILEPCSKNEMEVFSSLPSFRSMAFVIFPCPKHLDGLGNLT